METLYFFQLRLLFYSIFCKLRKVENFFTIFHRITDYMSRILELSKYVLLQSRVNAFIKNVHYQKKKNLDPLVSKNVGIGLKYSAKYISNEFIKHP